MSRRLLLLGIEAYIIWLSSSSCMSLKRAWTSHLIFFVLILNSLCFLLTSSVLLSVLFFIKFDFVILRFCLWNWIMHNFICINGYSFILSCVAIIFTQWYSFFYHLIFLEVLSHLLSLKSERVFSYVIKVIIHQGRRISLMIWIISVEFIWKTRPH